MRTLLLRGLVALYVTGFTYATARAALPDILYVEDFEDGVANGLTVRGGSYTLGPGIGSPTGFVAQDFHNVITLDTVPSDNAAVDVDFQINQGANGDFDTWVNAAFDASDGVYPAPGYGATVNPVGSDNPLAFLTRNGPIPGPSDEVILDQALNTIGAGEPHHMRFERFGPGLRVLLDGNPIMSATDSTYSGGQVGFRMFLPGIIDNIVVSVPEPVHAVWMIGGAAVTRRRACVRR